MELDQKLTPMQENAKPMQKKMIEMTKEITKKEMEKMDPSAFGTIEILKDEDATKKYGEKGKNGVVLITTKKK